MTMSRLSRTSLFAIAATAAIAISSLTPTNASAWGRFGGGFHGGFRGGFHAFHFGYGGGFYRQFPYRFGHWGFGGYHYGYGYRWWPHYGWWPRYRFWPRPIVYGALGGGALATAAPAAAPAATQTAQQPNCLVKQYLPNGAVQFADMCTQEQAIAMPNGAPNAMPMQPPGQPGPGPQ
jgi:hypothetical protein